MNTTAVVSPEQKPAIAMERNTPAAEQMKRLMLTFGLSFTNPENSQTVIPVINANRNVIAIGRKKLTTIMAT